jgi:hypothetical protein
MVTSTNPTSWSTRLFAFPNAIDEVFARVVAGVRAGQAGRPGVVL